MFAKLPLRGSFVKPKWARKVALQGVGADLFASVGCRSAVKLWSLSGVHRIAKLSLRVCLKNLLPSPLRDVALADPLVPISVASGSIPGVVKVKERETIS